MAERKWTDAQKEAISCQDPDILVSAAAGSGKTAVLTKRIINKLTDKDHPADISAMLIVTFTKAAAGELKERIASALHTAMAENPGDKRLRRQYVLLSKAKITTIHGFCLDLVKQNFQKLGLSPSVRVSDPAQSALLMEQVADVVIDHYYAGLPGFDDIDDFVSFADNFITLQDTNLLQILLTLYNKVASFPRGIHFLADSAKELKLAEDKGLLATVWGQFLFSHIKEMACHFRTFFLNACHFFDTDAYRDKYYPSFLHEYSFTESLLTAADRQNLDQIKDLLFSHTALPLKPIKKELQTPECLFYREGRKEFSEALSKLAEQFFSQSEETMRETAKKSRTIVDNLYRFLSAFDTKYRYEKRIRGLLDFNDLERYACQLLVNENGYPTPLAATISEQYKDIYIDEYQDVNKIQDLIFSAISQKTNRFMVGDIKQSIYGFRGAEPSLFADYRRDNAVKKVYLKHNFRCDRPIIDFVNQICGALFTSAGKMVPYDVTDQLVCGKDGGEHHPVEFTILDTGTKKAAERRADEANYVAGRIATLIQEGMNPGDICILLRSASRSASLYEEALESRGIPCRNRVTKDLFVNPEVLLVLNLLHIIDNPSRDIYLAGALKSPIFNFSLSELVTIRRYCQDGSLYDALRRYTADTNFSKGQYFLNKLSAYRTFASEPVDQLIWYLYTDTKIFAHVTEKGNNPSASVTRTNLLMLYEYARKFENGNFKGLYTFIRYISDIMESGSGFESSASASEEENTVRIMTIHQSKGLEFPVVFLCDCAASFNDSDKSDRVLLDRNYGITLKLSDDTGLASLDTVFRRIEGLAISEKANEEEIRVLYVALTRAIHRLIITGSVAKPDALVTECQLLSDMKASNNSYMFRTHDSFLAWILIAGGITYPPQIVSVSQEKEASESLQTVPPPLPSHEDTILSRMAIYEKRFSYSYPRQMAATLPAKLSVSELYPSILDEYDDALKLSDTRKRRMKLPRFWAAEQYSAADRGTATHQFMQFCCFSQLKNGDIEAEIERLVHQRFLDGHTASLIDRHMLQQFLNSDLFPTLCQSKECWRELRFNIRLPAASFSADPEAKEILQKETILVQGIMDCVFVDKAGRLTLLDYKTDHIPAKLRSDPITFENQLIERHRQQLSYYRAACTAMMCRPVDRILLYSFALGKPIAIPPASLLSL